MPAKIDKGKVAPIVPAAISSMAKINKFYGGGLPRPTLIGEPDRPVQELASGRVAYNSVSQALMEWSSKALVRMGGTHPQWVGATPKRAITPFRAYLAEKLLALHVANPNIKLLPHKDQIRKATEAAVVEWKKMELNSGDAKYQALATADEARFTRELALHEKRNPGYTAWTAAHRSGRSWTGAPMLPPHPRQLYVRSCVAGALHTDLELAGCEAATRSTALQKVRLTAVAEWRKMDAAAREPFESSAANAALKYETDLGEYEEDNPGYTAWLTATTKKSSKLASDKTAKTAKAKAAAKASKTAAKASKKSAKGASIAVEGGKKAAKGGKKSARAAGAESDDSDDSSEDEDDRESGQSSDDGGDSSDGDSSDGEYSELVEALLDISDATKPTPASRKRGAAALSESAVPAATLTKSGKKLKTVEPVSKGTAGNGGKATPARPSTAKAAKPVKAVTPAKASAFKATTTKAVKAAPAVKASAKKGGKAPIVAKVAKAPVRKLVAAVRGGKANAKAPAGSTTAVSKVISLSAPPADSRSLVGVTVMKDFYTDASKQATTSFTGVITEFSIIDGAGCWLARYEDNDEEDLEWADLKPLLARAQAAAAAAAKAPAKRGPARKQAAVMGSSTEKVLKEVDVLPASPTAGAKKVKAGPVAAKKGAAAAKKPVLKAKAVALKRATIRKGKRPSQAST